MTTNEKYPTGIYNFQGCAVIVTIENGGYHMSISHAQRLPTYEELKAARYKFCPDYCYMAQIFPPQDEFINVHPYCLHVYEIARRNDIKRPE